MTGHMSAFASFILSSFLIPLSFQIVSRSMVASLLALSSIALMSSEQLPVFVLMAPRYLREFTLAIVSPSIACDSTLVVKSIFVMSHVSRLAVVLFV